MASPYLRGWELERIHCILELICKRNIGLLWSGRFEFFDQAKNIRGGVVLPRELLLSLMSHSLQWVPVKHLLGKRASCVVFVSIVVLVPVRGLWASASRCPRTSLCFWRGRGLYSWAFAYCFVDYLNFTWFVIQKTN
jgi:hypothetical protein